MFYLAFAESIQLVPDGTLLLHIAIILVMIFVLNRTLFRPVNQILEERERRTVGRTGEARETLQRVEESLSRYERTLREARVEGYRLLEQQRAAAMSERQRRLDLVRKEVEGLISEQKRAIHAQAAEAQTTLGAEAKRVAAEISAHILGRRIGEAPPSNLRI